MSGAILAWPPDTFLVAVSILQQFGGVTEVVMRWPTAACDLLKEHCVSAETWTECISRAGAEWRAHAVHAALEIIPAIDERLLPVSALPLDPGEGQPPMPALVTTLWDIVMESTMGKVFEEKLPPLVAAALFNLIALADEASRNAGRLLRAAPDGVVVQDEYHRLTQRLLGARESLTLRIPLDRGRVLPKFHTPVVGITERSLTHFLAAHLGRNPVPRWYTLPVPTRGAAVGGRQARNFRLNLLLAPWPKTLVPRDFNPCKDEDHGLLALNSASKSDFRFFEFQPPDDHATVMKWLSDLWRKAERYGEIHGVVFPEMALSESELDSVKSVVQRNGAFLLAGVRRPKASEMAREPLAAPINEWEFAWSPKGESSLQPRISQSKHHRWQLQRSQIENYGLGSVLDPTWRWWENIGLGRREVTFITLDQDLTICPLICEDLARQEPVSNLIRSVGPQLVIALLMDGPQDERRWPARYASVLAEDPGSSVLTLTSAGMVDLTTPRYPGTRERRIVALWRDAHSGIRELVLPPNHDGILLSMSTESHAVTTADGRHEAQGSSFPRISGYHPIRVD